MDEWNRADVCFDFTAFAFRFWNLDFILWNFLSNRVCHTIFLQPFLLSVMATEKEITRISKFLSLVLRHRPETIGIVLDENGWTDVSTLLDKMQTTGTTIDLAILKEVVATNSKKRFAFNDDESMIRANQGHSVEVDLAYEPKEPPVFLYHGTSEQTISVILKEGLQKRNRHHVHLSAHEHTAKAVGQRHGKPVVLIVSALQMHKEGYIFYQTANDVWLTEHVPPAYLDNQF